MNDNVKQLCSRTIPLVSLASLFLGCGSPIEQALEDNIGVSVAAWTEYAPDRAKAANFFAYDNTVNITINLTDADWTAIKTESPIGGVCSHLAIQSNGESPDRYPWRNAATVTVSDSKGITTATSFSGVQIKKKSFCGSLTTGADQQPSLKLKFTTSSARDKMGVHYLTLNNSLQDGSWIRQTLGYYLMGLAGVPHPRANYAKVRVVTETTSQEYVYVNVEPLRGSFIDNPENGFVNSAVSNASGDARAKGNLYEFSLGEEFNAAGTSYVGTEKISAIQGTTARPDLAYTISQLAEGGASTATLKTVVDVDKFAKFWAMEVLLKHWDGYTSGRNNTYVYNDVVATSGTQSDATVNFKFIPWGIDQILQPGRDFAIDENSVVSKIMRRDPAMYAKLIAAVNEVRGSVFSRSMLDGAIKTRIDTLRTQLMNLGKDTTGEINQIRTQLKLARAAAIMLGGSGSSSFYLADKDSGDVIHASGSEQVPNNPNYYEVYRRAAQDNTSDRWIIGSNSYGITLRSEAYGRNLYASPNLLTSAGHKYIFQAPAGTYESSEGWSQIYDGSTYTFPGTFTLRNSRTGGYAHFSSSSDLTPAGHPRIYQGDATHMFMY